MGYYIEDYHGIARIVALHQEQGGKVVLARGVFDAGVHRGHRDFLRRAKDLGGLDAMLLVNVNNDEWVRKWKRDPVDREDERALDVADQEMVDYTVVYPGIDIHPELALALFARPDIIVRDDKNPEIIEEEKDIVGGWERYGYRPEFVILPRSKYEYSTSERIKRIERHHMRRIVRGMMIKKMEEESKKSH